MESKLLRMKHFAGGFIRVLLSRSVRVAAVSGGYRWPTLKFRGRSGAVVDLLVQLIASGTPINMADTPVAADALRPGRSPIHSERMRRMAAAVPAAA